MEADLFGPGEYGVELFIECKQESLGVHHLPTERLRVSWCTIYTIFDDHRAISEQEFFTMLGHSKLI